MGYSLNFLKGGLYKGSGYTRDQGLGSKLLERGLM